MLAEFRAWLEAELKLLGNASHHAYSFGQANMAKRALERFDEDVANRAVVLLEPGTLRSALSEIGTLAERGGTPPGLAALADALRASLAEVAGS